MARGNFGRFLVSRDDPDAESVLLRTLADTEEMGNAKQRDAVRINLGWLYRKRGDLARARPLFELCRRPDAERAFWNKATSNLAEIALSQGDLSLARTLRDELPAEAADERGERFHARLDALLAEATASGPRASR